MNGKELKNALELDPKKKEFFGMAREFLLFLGFSDEDIASLPKVMDVIKSWDGLVNTSNANFDTFDRRISKLEEFRNETKAKEAGEAISPERDLSAAPLEVFPYGKK